MLSSERALIEESRRHIFTPYLSTSREEHALSRKCSLREVVHCFPERDPSPPKERKKCSYFEQRWASSLIIAHAPVWFTNSEINKDSPFTFFLLLLARRILSVGQRIDQADTTRNLRFKPFGGLSNAPIPSQPPHPRRPHLVRSTRRNLWKNSAMF